MSAKNVHNHAVSNPLVSIVIPVYNGSNFLQEAIDSALAQTYVNTEVIVINDGSNDDGLTESIALSFGDKIRYFSKTNGGVSSALNVGINVMKGEYFSWLSHDDIYFPEKIETQLTFLKQLDREVILHCDYQFIDSDSKYLRTRKLPSIPPELFKLSLISSQPLHGCTLLIPKRFFLEVGAFDETLRTTQDYDLWIKMAERYDFIHLPIVLLSARSHSGQSSKAQAALWLNECSDFYLKHLEEVFETWVEEKTPESLSVFTIKSAIKMQRMGLNTPLKLTNRVLRDVWARDLLNFKSDSYFWLGYFILFRLKWFLLRPWSYCGFKGRQ